MSEPKFTQGEWRMRLCGRAPVISADDMIHICTCSDVGVGEFEVLANALLIEQAPQMYRALKEARDNLACIDQVYPLLIKRIDDVLARVDGEL